jgi:hypothetical protein
LISGRIVKALYDYKAAQDGDLAFEKGDEMEIISEG